MFAGANRHYVIDRICGRHFIQTAERGGVSATLAKEALQEVIKKALPAKEALEKNLPPDFLHSTIWDGIAAMPGNLRM
jgi:serine/threonine-protein kinase HipA